MLANHLHPPSSFDNIQITEEVKILGIYFKSEISEEENFRLNFEPNINKIKSICSAWSNRTLSLKGKVTLITSLMISLLQFPCTAISTPARVFTDFKKIMLDFLWNGKKSKIAYKVMIQELGAGGLKVPDLWTRVQVIHLNWVKYMWRKQDSLKSTLLTDSVPLPTLQSVLLCKTSLAPKIDQRYRMLVNILRTWFEFHSWSPTNETEAQQEPLWYNDSLTINKSVTCWTSCFNAGILTVNDILHPSLPRFLSHDKISAKYNITTSFLQTLQIRPCIPFHWKRFLTSPASHNLSISPCIKSKEGSVIDISEVPSKKLYTTLLTFQAQLPAAQRKWNFEFPPPQDVPLSDHWESKYRAAFRSIRETKLQAFQFKLLHRIIPCNKYLKNIRLIDADQCSFCSETDTLTHFFYSCPKVQPFWTALGNWFQQQTNIEVGNVQQCHYMLGVPRGEPHAIILNFIILSVKFYVFRQKMYYDAKLDLTAFLNEFRSKLKIEKYICTLEGKADRFNIWRNVLSALG